MPNVNLTGVETTSNKSTSVVTDQASNTKYPSVKSVYDWAVSVFTTTAAVATQISTALVGYLQSGGALGTPSSGTLTNCTGLPITGVDNYLGITMTAPVAIISSPADSTTYYCGGHNLLMVATQGNRRVYFNKAMTIKEVTLYYLVSGTLGSNETLTVSVRLNQTTDYLISSAVTWNALNIQFTNSSMSIPVVAGDYIEFKHVTPAWITNPTNVNFTWNIYGE